MSRARALSLTLLASTQVAADWPQFLGPERNGVSRETGLAAAWTGRGPRELWRVPLGRGYSGASVVDGVLFTMADTADGQHVLALDALTGALRWDAVIDAPYMDAQGYHGPRATPTVAGDRVVTVSAGGRVVALARTDGRALWTTDLTQRIGGERPTWGYSGSPLVADGRVYLSAGGTAGVLALSLADGEVQWSQGSWGAAYSSPVRAFLGGRDQILFFTAAGPVGVAPDTGSLLWSFPWTTSYEVHAATPLVLPGDRVFIASGYGVGGAMIELEGATPRELWRSKSVKNKLSTSVVHGGHLYGFNEDRLTAVDVRTGAPAWDAMGYGRGSLVLVDDHLLVLSEACKLTLHRASPTADTLVGASWDGLTAAPCWTAPAVAGQIVYARDATSLVAVDLR
jgi:outer membrane protein assembly factor BamB